ncbi:hypothetical protein VSK90_12865 [Bacillus swezeyi]|uniref:hypothetical protein n=1 Tax=Bacillus swezeyi TaxID=1925020 RepID=UPI0039C7508E
MEYADCLIPVPQKNLAIAFLQIKNLAGAAPSFLNLDLIEGLGNREVHLSIVK